MNKKVEKAGQLENTKDSPKKENKFVKFILDKKYYVSLVVIILIIFGWAFIKISLLNSSFKTEKEIIINNYELKLDSLNIDRMKLTATTFSWAIRGELMRGNIEQINQYFAEFIKTPGILKLQLINPETSTIEISTDKKDEGLIIPMMQAVTDQITLTDSTDFKIITPITGLNKKISIFIITIKSL